MTDPRGHGQGAIERRVGRSGQVRFRARYKTPAGNQTIGTFDSYEEADGALAAFIARLCAEAPVAGETLGSWAATWLDDRDTDGHHRSVARDRHAVKRWTRSELALLPLAAITPRDVRDWVAAQVRGEPRPARQTIANALNLLRVCLEQACERGRIERNPALGVKVPKMARTADRWTWLTADEVTRLLAGEGEERDLYAVAVYTGVRAGELFGLEWRDVDLDAGVASIRHSWQGAPTKAGVARQVSLVTPAVEALRRQRERSRGRRHVFPARDGQPRTRDQMPDLAASLAAAGIERHVRFHDLRHTCASHLVQGTWAPRWLARPLRLEEVQVWLGHTSSSTTSRYAHLCPEAVSGLVVRGHGEPAKVLPLRRARKGARR